MGGGAILGGPPVSLNHYRRSLVGASIDTATGWDCDAGQAREGRSHASHIKCRIDTCAAGQSGAAFQLPQCRFAALKPTDERQLASASKALTVSARS